MGVDVRRHLAVTLTSILKSAWTSLFESGPPRPYRDRPCQGGAWRQRFQDAPKQEIRNFLSTFAKGFAYRDSEKLKFGPEDGLLRIYRAHYPSKWLPDALEIETLAILIQKRYGVALSKVWSDNLTLGQLFQSTRRVNDA